jgi:hypothetical protein
MKGEIDQKTYKFYKITYKRNIAIKEIIIKYETIIKWEDNLEFLICQSEFQREEREKSERKNKKRLWWKTVVVKIIHTSLYGRAQRATSKVTMEGRVLLPEKVARAAKAASLTLWRMNCTHQPDLHCSLTTVPHICFKIHYDPWIPNCSKSTDFKYILTNWALGLFLHIARSFYIYIYICNQNKILSQFFKKTGVSN